MQVNLKTKIKYDLLIDLEIALYHQYGTDSELLIIKIYFMLTFSFIHIITHNANKFKHGYCKQSNFDSKLCD